MPRWYDRLTAGVCGAGLPCGQAGSTTQTMMGVQNIPGPTLHREQWKKYGDQYSFHGVSPA